MSQEDRDRLTVQRERASPVVAPSGHNGRAHTIEADLGRRVFVTEGHADLQAGQRFPDSRAPVADRPGDQPPVRAEGAVENRTLGPTQPLQGPAGRTGPDARNAFVPAGHDTGSVGTEHRAVDLRLLLQDVNERSTRQRVHPREAILAEGDQQAARGIDGPSPWNGSATDPDRAKQRSVTGPPDAYHAVLGESEDQVRALAEEGGSYRAASVERPQQSTGRAPQLCSAVPSRCQEDATTRVRQRRDGAALHQDVLGNHRLNSINPHLAVL